MAKVTVYNANDAKVNLLKLTGLTPVPSNDWRMTIFPILSDPALLLDSDCDFVFVMNDENISKPIPLQGLFTPTLHVDFNKVRFSRNLVHDIHEIDVSHFDTSKYTDFTSLFESCAYLKEIIGLENLNWSNITSASRMFAGCKALKQINVSAFDVSKCTNLSYMFSTCSELEIIKGIENLNTTNIKSFSGIFARCDKLTTCNLSKWNFDKADNRPGANRMFYMSNSEARPIKVIFPAVIKGQQWNTYDDLNNLIGSNFTSSAEIIKGPYLMKPPCTN